MAITQSTTVENIKEFQQVRTPDYALLASLVNRAKGPERAMAQFAEDTGIGASTLSRIVNMNIKKPLSVDNIIRIFEARYRTEDTMLLDSLARANGLFPKDYADRVKEEGAVASRRNEEVNRERMMKNALIAGIAASGLPVKEVFNSPRINRSDMTAMHPRMLGDFILNIRSEANASEISDWAFFIYGHVMNDRDKVIRRTPIGEVRRILEQVSGCFLTDAWQPNFFRGLKLSFVFADIELFECFKAAVQAAKVNNEMTVILIDPTTFQVVNETWIPGEYERLTEVSIFDYPAPSQEADDLYDDYYEEGDVND